LIEKYSLDEWEIHFTRQTIDGGLAQININYEGRICTFVLADNWDGPVIKPTQAQMKASAKHEVIELLLVPLRYLGRQRFVTEEEYNAACEGVVRKLEKIL